MFAFPLFLASESTLGWADQAETLAWVAGIPGLVLSCTPRPSTCRWPAAPCGRAADGDGLRRRTGGTVPT